MKKLIAMFVSLLVLTGCSSHGDFIPLDEGLGIDYTVYDAEALHFAVMMIPHHEQAVEMAEIALANTTNGDILKLAEGIIESQKEEITKMTSWLSIAGIDFTKEHNMMMDGMLSDEEIAALKAATGAEFDRLFFEGMIKHHEGALAMAEPLKEHSNLEVNELIAAIIKEQTREIAEMKALLGQ
jgi:uncharacterized protein (DUF305 family)